MIVSYCGSLQYVDLGKKSQVKMWYREKYMKVTEESSCRYELELSDVDTDSKGQRHQLWAAPARFCATRYIIDPRYLPEDESSTEIRRLASREIIAEFRAAHVKSRGKYRKQHVLELFTLRNVRVGEELFMDYGMKYSFE